MKGLSVLNERDNKYQIIIHLQIGKEIALFFILKLSKCIALINILLWSTIFARLQLCMYTHVLILTDCPTQIIILERAVCISHRDNGLAIGMYPTIFPPVMGK